MSSHSAEYSELLPNGTIVPLELGLEEDAERELHHFVKLSRMGNYLKAQWFYDNILGNYDKFFPVIAEYADMLLEQGHYGRAAEFLSHHLEVLNGSLDTGEVQLLILMKSLADVYSKGALRSALVEAKQAYQLLVLQSDQASENLPEEIHIFEIYINIAVLGYKSSEWVNGEGWMRCPFTRPTRQHTNGFVQWFCILREQRLLWEASRVPRALLPVISILPADDLRELLSNTLPRPLELSVPDVWASIMISLHQAHYLLDAALITKLLGNDNLAANSIYELGRERLEVADQAWNMLPEDQDSLSLHLPLALEKIAYGIVEADFSSHPASSDYLFALLNLLTEVDSRRDIRSEIIIRLYSLLINCAILADWRDLYSIFELQTVDCDNLVDYVHTWKIFAAWTVNTQRSFQIISRSPLLEVDRSSLLLSLYAPQAITSQEWKEFLVKRSPSLQPVVFSQDEPLTFDQSRHDYALTFDIPAYTTLHKWLQQQLLIQSEASSVNIELPLLENSHIMEIKSLIEHLRLFKTHTKDSESPGLSQNKEKQKADLSEPQGQNVGPELDHLQADSETLTSAGGRAFSAQAQGVGSGYNPGSPDSNIRELIEMEEILRRELTEKEIALGPNNTSTLDTVYSLGGLYNKHGLLEVAGDMYLRALGGYQAVYGPDHLKIFRTANNIGKLYHSQGRLEEAQQMFERALNGKWRLLGPAHISTLRTINNLGDIYLDKGDLENAEAILKDAAVGKEKLLGRHHPSTDRATNSLVKLYLRQGKTGLAEEIVKRGLIASLHQERTLALHVAGGHVGIQK